MRESGPRKRDEDGDDDGDVDEDDHRGDGSLDGTPAPPRETGLSPLASCGAGVPPGIVMAIYINSLATVNTNFLPLYAAV